VTLKPNELFRINIYRYSDKNWSLRVLQKRLNWTCKLNTFCKLWLVICSGCDCMITWNSELQSLNRCIYLYLLNHIFEWSMHCAGSAEQTFIYKMYKMWKFCSISFCRWWYTKVILGDCHRRTGHGSFGGGGKTKFARIVGSRPWGRGRAP